MPLPPDTIEQVDPSDTEIGSSETDFGKDDVRGTRVALVGRFGGMNQREATNVIRSYQASVVDLDSESIDWVVIGAEESPIAEADLVSPQIRAAAAEGKLEILHETELWQRLGLVDIEQSIRRYYTPAMLAHLLGVSVRVIRRWHRRGLITPIRTLHKLHYFDFQEVATARRLAQWIASGASSQAIEQRLVELVEVLPNIQRPLDQLSILIEGKQVLLRQGEGLLEPGGQLRFDFDAMEPEDEHETCRGESPPVLSIHRVPEDAFEWREDAFERREDAFEQLESRLTEDDELLAAAFDAEDIGDLETAVDYCHAILARDGPRAEIDLQIGELLYRMGHMVAARERYYAAIEHDPEFVEARASLGALLAEMGQPDLAIAALRGALSLHDNYAEVHYDLAKVLDEVGREIEARHHWICYLELAPDSPWAAEAKQRIDEIDDT